MYIYVYININIIWIYLVDMENPIVHIILTCWWPELDRTFPDSLPTRHGGAVPALRSDEGHFALSLQKVLAASRMGRYPVYLAVRSVASDRFR